MNKVEIDHFRHYQFITRLRGNGAGALAFLTRQANLQENRYDSVLWLHRYGEARPLTAPGQIDQYWWRDENSLVLAREGTERDRARREKGLPRTLLQELRLDRAGEAQDFLRLDLDVEDLAFLPDGRLLLVALWDARVEQALEAAGGDADRAAEALKAAADFEVMDELPVWDNGEGFTGKKRRRLYLWAEGELRALTDEKTTVEGLRLSPSGHSAVFIARRYDKVYPVANRLMRLDTTTLEVADITFKEAPFRHDLCLPASDETVLVWGSDMARYGVNQNPGLYRWQQADADAQPLDESGWFDCWNSVGTDLSMAAAPRPVMQGDNIYWVSTVGERSVVMHAGLFSSEPAPFTLEEGAVLELEADGENLYITALRGLGGPELYQLHEDGGETRLTALNTGIEAAYELAAPTPLRFENAEGIEIRGWVLKPDGLAPGQRCPAILNIHGGPKTVYGAVAFHEMQLWRARGWAVLFCNPPGSDGRGDVFADIRGQMGDVDYRDIMAFVDAALAENDWIDPDRLGVTGGSYGGFMANWIVGHTGRFRAAVSQRGISNWGTLAYTSDIGFYFEADQCGADLLDDPEKVWAQSPLKYAKNVTTPTLLIHSEQDYRCPWGEALQFYTALQLAGVETRLCLFRGENHELSRGGRPKSRLRRLEEITRWFDKYI